MVIPVNDKILIKRLKRKTKTQQEISAENFEKWVSYWRANPHRFITDYLGLTLYDFQKVLIYQMNKYPNFIFVASRGLAKSTLTLLYALERAVLYPGQRILVVCPVKSQSRNFIKKVEEFKRESANLRSEIDEVKTGVNESSITFKNGSVIFTAPYSENALGIRCNILIVDEFVRTEKEVITRVFVPMLTSPRLPPYRSLTTKEKEKLPEEPQRQLYLSSIRGAEEWSYKEFEKYIEYMLKGNMDYITIALPYHFGVKNKFITRKIVEQSFRDNQESLELLKAEYMGIPERGSGNSFFKYAIMDKARTNSKALYCMSDEEFIEYKDNMDKWLYYQEKLPNEIRILTMDVALIESPKNDNTSFWIIRLIPSGGKYEKIIAYGESMHGINSLLQTKRAKQLFYELQCDWFVLDCQGSGIGVFDSCTDETYDEVRDIQYPAWTVINYDDIKMTNRTISQNAIPLIYSVKTPIQLKSEMFMNMRNALSTGDVQLLVETQEAVEYLMKVFKFYKIKEEDLRNRLLNPYVQTNMLINEAINLEQIVTQGYINLKEKSGRRKDRVMSLAYGLYYSKILEDEYKNKRSKEDILSYVLFA